MGYAYTTIDGERVEVHVAAAFRKLDAAFYKATGEHLTVASGTRTRALQEKLYAAYLNGGTLAARPGTSNHEEDGPIGPRAIDVHDTGRDAGVTTAGTKRANWLRANAKRFGFNPAGYGFRQVEPWHIEFTGSLAGAVPAAASSKLAPAGGQATVKVATQKRWINWRFDWDRLTVDNDTSRAYVAAIKRYQQFLADTYGYTGAIDGIWGPGTQAGYERHMANVLGRLAHDVDQQQRWLNFRMAAGLDVDGKRGPKTIAEIKRYQEFLAEHYGYEGAIDGDWGAGTQAAAERHFLWCKRHGWKAPK